MNRGPATWRLATFNIQYCAQSLWFKKREALVTLLHSLRADFLCLQEVSAPGLTWIRERLSPSGYAGVGRDDGVHAGEHVPILVLNPAWQMRASGTFWFSPTPDRPSRAWGAAHPRICTWTRLHRATAAHPGLVIFNLHLDHRSRRAREESMRLLSARVATLAPACPAMICGDFNLRDRAKAYAQLAENPRGLVDAGRTHGSVGPTWDGWGPFPIGRSRIDYVLADRSVRLDRYEVADNRLDRNRLSDHHPVIVDFSLPVPDGADPGTLKPSGHVKA